LRFAASSTFAQLYIAPLLPEFLALHPGITLDLRLSDTQFDLIEGSFDLALRNAALDDSSLKCRKLADDRRVLCASPAYLEQYGVPRHPDELSGHQLIGFRDLSPRALISDGGQSGYFDPRLSGSRLVLDDGLSQKIATLAGAGISVNSLWSVHRELAEGKLVRVLPDCWVDDQSALWLVYPKSNVLTAKVRIFIDFLMDRIGNAPAWRVP
jgi:DNA-binding transcriptional LysR family regulator